ncbi:MAG: hypothetical protein JWN51_159 [Phycisphaerales bacterium]|nr:hypothetical protein [Phycisphaerales bacterium]
MRRMSRRLFTAIAAISFLICIATMLLWIRSYWRWDTLSQTTPDAAGRLRLISIESVNGRLVIGVAHNSSRNLPNWTRDGRFLHTQDASTVTFYRTTLRQWIGFDFNRFTSRRSGASEWHLTIPSWFIALLTAGAPAVWLMPLVRRKNRRRPGFCPSCGYDLRASPDRCPECGADRPTAPSWLPKTKPNAKTPRSPR